MEKVGILDSHLEYFSAIWYIYRHSVAIWYIFPHFGILCQEKSGNPELCDKNFGDFEVG
jgi:hypothetical protein